MGYEEHKAWKIWEQHLSVKLSNAGLHCDCEPLSRTALHLLQSEISEFSGQ
jgi:hypothetical protein